ncbi:UbiH/UbiF family hydroxylase [Bradyrhizobium sp. KBS0727]|uniref:UbiH/UbiF family hydroxylase n=1 Tax=unclassified Bradyrhizobium TaxID=2631580 RepID=UPI00110E3DCF|nr:MULTISPECIES: UbiH/UbiF family hydroxylase [unclassified Bradyrhizobium]QDW38784.1 UbiH/UbiF family hydroxylase [Bradyrhizobium sp. KBS0725]QDW45387.1 UbiH/UbiF family hydroxylase [Bradyrhizobium sp. KBS0727]
MNDTSQIYDTVVIGGGPAGLTAAIALAGTGAKTALLARRAPYADNRTTALLGASADLLERLAVWPRCRDKAAALQTMRLVDDTGRLIRAPEVRFSSDEIGLEQFGYNIDNRSLISALEERAAELANLTRYDDEAVTIEPHHAEVSIRTSRGQALTARLVVGADGRQSPSRAAAGIEIKRRDLHQSALTFNIAHSHPHKNISTEFHTPQGPCVFVPLPGNRCSVVWVSATKEAERLMSLGDDELSDAAEKQSHSILGRVQVEAGRNVFPLAIESPRQFASHRVALVGESAHVVPPIGAQGLNMGLRDAADIADIAGNAMSRGEDPGSPQVLARYQSARRADVASRTIAIDIANRSLLSDFLAVQSLRAAGMHLLGAFGPLRRLAMREGLAPSWKRVS